MLIVGQLTMVLNQNVMVTTDHRSKIRSRVREAYDFYLSFYQNNSSDVQIHAIFFWQDPYNICICLAA